MFKPIIIALIVISVAQCLSKDDLPPMILMACEECSKGNKIPADKYNAYCPLIKDAAEKALDFVSRRRLVSWDDLQAQAYAAGTEALTDAAIAARKAVVKKTCTAAVNSAAASVSSVVSPLVVNCFKPKAQEKCETTFDALIDQAAAAAAGRRRLSQLKKDLKTLGIKPSKYLARHN